MTILFIQIPFVLYLILVAIGSGLAFLSVALIAVIISSLRPSDASCIAIFGSKGAGKTTLWQQLQGIFIDANYHPTLGSENIDEFTIEYNGKTKTILKSKDYGGDDNLVKYYGEIIREGSFVYYLIDLTRLYDYKKETRARLMALSKLLGQKDLKDKVGLRLVATHFKEYLDSHPGKTLSDAKHELMSVVGINDVKDVNIEDKIMVAELTDKNYIDQFYDQIINNVEK